MTDHFMSWGQHTVRLNMAFSQGSCGGEGHNAIQQGNLSSRMAVMQWQESLKGGHLILFLYSLPLFSFADSAALLVTTLLSGFLPGHWPAALTCVLLTFVPEYDIRGHDQGRTDHQTVPSLLPAFELKIITFSYHIR
jgi:hypothetical protein